MKNNKKNSKYLGNCQVCNSIFGKNDIQLIKREKDYSLFHVTCAVCRSSALIALLSEKSKKLNKNRKIITAVGMLTDLTKDDLPALFRNRFLCKKDITKIFDYCKALTRAK